MMLTLVIVLWLIGMLMLAWGVFAAPSPYDNKYQSEQSASWRGEDAQYFTIRLFGGILIFAAMGIVIVDTFLK